VLSLLLGSQRDAARIAAERRRVCGTALAAVDRYFLPTGRSAANPRAAVAAINRYLLPAGHIARIFLNLL